MRIIETEEASVMLTTSKGTNWYNVNGTDDGCAIEMYSGHYEEVKGVFIPDPDDEDEYEDRMIDFERKLQDYINSNNL